MSDSKSKKGVSLTTIFNSFILTAVLSALLIGIIIGIVVLVNRSNEDILINKQIKGADYLASSLELVDELESKNIAVGEKYKSYLEGYAKEILTIKTSNPLPFETVAKLIYIDSHYDKKHLKKLNKKLEKYFDNENKLFAIYPYNTYEKLDIPNIKIEWAYKNAEMAKYLDYSGDYISKYQIKIGMAVCYKLNIDTLDGMDEVKKAKVIKSLGAIYDYFDSIGELGTFNHAKFKPYMQDDILYKKDLISGEDAPQNLTSVIYAGEVARFDERYNNDITLSAKSQLIFAKLDSSDDFGDVKSATFTDELAKALSVVDNPSKNHYFTENLDSILLQNFVYCAE
jgi:hypothetical protein